MERQDDTCEIMQGLSCLHSYKTRACMKKKDWFFFSKCERTLKDPDGNLGVYLNLGFQPRTVKKTKAED